MMNSLTPQDRLATLWQTAPEPNGQDLLEDLRRLKQMRTRLRWTVVVALISATAILAIAESAGRIATHGVLSAIWVVGLAIGGTWQRRARCNRLDALTLDTVTLLQRMLARAKVDLFVARCLYAGVPVGALLGTLAIKFLVSDSVQATKAVHSPSRTGFDVAGTVLLAIMIGAGFILSRSSSKQVQELQKKLKSFEADL